MKPQTLKHAVDLARKTGWILVASGDTQGVPHVAAASRIRPEGTSKLLIGGWFCPQTLLNLKQNKNISLVIWKSSADKGFQLVGEVEEIEDLAILDGLVSTEAISEVPQVERQLRVRVEKAFVFSHAPHLDVEEES